MPPPSPREFEPSLPTEVEQVVLRALSKSPQARFASGGDLGSGAAPGIRWRAASDGSIFQPLRRGPPSAASGNGPGHAQDKQLARLVYDFRHKRTRKRRVWSRRMWLGMAAGGALGCGLLLVLLAVGLSLFGRLRNGAAPEATAVQSPTATSSPAASVEPLRLTLGALNAAADATFTARAVSQPASPGATAAVIQPIGLRDWPVLSGGAARSRGRAALLCAGWGWAGERNALRDCDIGLGFWTRAPLRPWRQQQLSGGFGRRALDRFPNRTATAISRSSWLIGWVVNCAS